MQSNRLFLVTLGALSLGGPSVPDEAPATGAGPAARPSEALT
jgi:hypothetical protein